MTIFNQEFLKSIDNRRGKIENAPDGNATRLFNDKASEWSVLADENEAPTNVRVKKVHKRSTRRGQRFMNHAAFKAVKEDIYEEEWE